MVIWPCFKFLVWQGTQSLTAVVFQQYLVIMAFVAPVVNYDEARQTSRERFLHACLEVLSELIDWYRVIGWAIIPLQYLVAKHY